MKVKAIKFLLFGLLSLSALFSHAQAKKNLEYSGFFDSYYFRGPWSVTAGAGIGLYNGDLGSFVDGGKISPTFNLGVAYKPWPRVRFGFQFGMINLEAAETNDRALASTGSLKEFMFYGKYYLIEDIITRHTQFRKDKMKLIKPFVSLGIAPVLYNSTLTDTTGLESSSSGFALAIPVGGGLQFDFTHRVSLSLDIAYRYVFNDQLDAFGVDQGGGSAKDSYATVGLTLQYSPFAKRMHKKKFKAPKQDDEGGSSAGGTSENNAGTSDGGSNTDTQTESTEETTEQVEPAAEEVEEVENIEEEAPIEEEAVEEPVEEEAEDAYEESEGEYDDW